MISKTCGRNTKKLKTKLCAVAGNETNVQKTMARNMYNIKYNK